KKMYLSQAIDGYFISTTFLQKGNGDQVATPVRFSGWFNFGVNANYDFSNHVGIFTGLGIKNIGFIEKYNDSTVKRRVYAIGIPLGVKFGNIDKRTFGIIGGGVDFPFHYKEKGFAKGRENKVKFSEWFSDRTLNVMPYIFAGFSTKSGVVLKAQYYLNNFMNPNYMGHIPTLGGPAPGLNFPYANFTKPNLLMISLGFNIPYGSKVKKEYTEEKATDPTLM